MAQDRQTTPTKEEEGTAVAQLWQRWQVAGEQTGWQNRRTGRIKNQPSMNMHPALHPPDTGATLVPHRRYSGEVPAV